MRWCSFLFLALSFFGAFSQPLIRDDSYMDPGFYKFKIKLEMAVVNRDTSALRKLLADTIYESVDGCGYPGCSTEEFMQTYFSGCQQNGIDCWREWELVIRFGFQKVKLKDPDHKKGYDTIAFFAPSYHVEEDSELIVLGENVNIRKEPSLKSEILSVVSFEKFRCNCGILLRDDSTYITADKIDWVKVIFPNGTVGYVKHDFTSDSIIKDLVVEKINGVWKITTFFNDPGC